MVLVRMKSTLVQVTLGVDDLRDGLARSKHKLEAEQRELETVRRRKELATGIQDAETIAIADRFERQHAERVTVLEEKIAVQTRELELAERELGEMKAEFRGAMAGGPPPEGTTLDDPLEETSEADARRDLDALARERARVERDAAAQQRLEELKKRMGK